MRVYIMGEVGVGKSHAISHLKNKGYEVIEDPVIELGEEFLSGSDSLKIQLAVASKLYTAAAVKDDGIFDSCLAQSFQFVIANHSMGLISDSAFLSIRSTYMEMIKALGKNDVYIYLDKPRWEIRKQIAERGRPYEQDNPFITAANNTIHSRLKEFVTGCGLKVHTVVASPGYYELEQIIKEITEGDL